MMPWDGFVESLRKPEGRGLPTPQGWRRFAIVRREIPWLNVKILVPAPGRVGEGRMGAY
jgi:hypothetical protein